MTSELFIPCFTPSLIDQPSWAAQAQKVCKDLFPNRYAMDDDPESPLALAAINYRLAVDTNVWWGDKEMDITVAFQAKASNALRNKTLQYANAWNKFCNKRFVYSKVDPMVRVTFDGDGYWSYLGTDVLGIPPHMPTMCLQGFTVNSPESEWNRVVKHEFGHTLGCSHEHMRPEIVDLLDVEKTVKYFMQTQGWSRKDVMQQVLTPISVKSIRGTVGADDTSIMCYQLPASITKNGKPIRGGDDINELDAKFIATIYPKAVAPPVEPGHPTHTGKITVSGTSWTVEIPTGLAPGSYDFNIAPRI